VLDWIATYLDHPERYPVLSSSKPGDIKAMIPASPPAAGETLPAILADFESKIIPGITHWNHPAFFGYFATSSNVPAILAEMLVATLDVKAMLWKTSPAATELEEVVTDWIRQMLGLSDAWWGITTDTASISSMLALAAARESRPELAIRERGMSGRSDLPRLRIYCSSHAHSSIDKGALALGFGLENVVKIGDDEDFRMRPDQLASAIAADRANGFLPLACVATVGTTSTSSIDPVPAIAEICRREGVWLHVDGAYGGMLAIVPEYRHILSGVELADSLVVNPHKWLLTPMDCSLLWTSRPAELRAAFSLVPEFLRTPDAEDALSLSEYGPALGRRFRALKLWAVLRCYGRSGLQEHIRRGVALAERFESWVAAEPGWELCAPRHFSLVCFRLEGDDARSKALLERVNAGGEMFLSHAALGGRYVLRMAIGQMSTTEDDVRRAWDVLRREARGL
jgi:aromatic-L-amino-acid decarboxylase